MRSENNKIVEEGIKKIEEGNVVKKDSLLSVTILIDFFQMLCIWLFFVLNGISRLLLLLPIISREFNQLILFRDGPLEKWLEGGGGRGGGQFLASTNLFFRSLLVQEFFFFQVNPSARIFFFFRQILLFLNSGILIHYLCFCAL